MIKRALAELGLAPLAVIGLVTFVAVFIGVTVWALTRSRRQVDNWSALPLRDGSDPLEPRDDPPAPPERSGGCGKCADCSCRAPGVVTIAPLAAAK